MEALEQEELDNQLLGVDDAATLPSVPTASVPAASARGILNAIQYAVYSFDFVSTRYY